MNEDYGQLQRTLHPTGGPDALRVLRAMPPIRRLGIPPRQWVLNALQIQHKPSVMPVLEEMQKRGLVVGSQNEAERALTEAMVCHDIGVCRFILEQCKSYLPYFSDLYCGQLFGQYAECQWVPHFPELIQAGVRCNVADQLRITPLVHAAKTPHCDVVHMLLDRGMDINQRNDEAGYTALHAACFAGRVRMVGALLGRGANPNMLDHKGRTPLYALFGMMRVRSVHHSDPIHEEIAALLLNNGARLEVEGALDPLEKMDEGGRLKFLRMQAQVQAGQLSAHTDTAHGIATASKPRL